MYRIFQFGKRYKQNSMFPAKRLHRDVSSDSSNSLRLKRQILFVLFQAVKDHIFSCAFESTTNTGSSRFATWNNVFRSYEAMFQPFSLIHHLQNIFCHFALRGSNSKKKKFVCFNAMQFIFDQVLGHGTTNIKISFSKLPLPWLPC